MAYSQFSFVLAPTGTLPGDSFVQQTEDAINALGQQVYEVVEDNVTLSAQVQQAIATANSAQNTASTALNNSQNALTQLSTLTATVNTYDQKITQAVSQSTSAVQTATAAQESAQSAQESAQAAQEAAESASSQAQQAQTAASEAQTQAEAAQTAAEAASAQATDASNSAQQAQQQAQQAQQNAESAANSAENLAQNAVMVTEQSFLESQQTQARTNIGAAASDNAVLTGTTTAEDISASGTVTATGGFVGDLTGTASQATADGNGNNIAATYATIANTYTKAQVDAKVSSVYRFMGSVATYNDLPSSGQTVGDTYNVEDTGANYAWDGTQWDKLSETVDLSQYLTIASAQSTYLPIDGNAATASKWETARTITLSGDATGSVSLDGSSNATLNLTIANGSVTNAMLAASSVTFAKVNSGDVATQAEAEAGTVNNAFMTPLRVAQAIASQVGSSYLPIAGGTLTGNLILNANPTTALGAATKQYVDSAVSTGTSDAVLYTQQSLSTSQQTQARSNIGVVTLTNDGVQVLGGNVDYNTILDPGIYQVHQTGATNGPGAWANNLIVLRQTGTSYISQIAFPAIIKSGAAPAYRVTTNRGTSWTDWQQFIPVMGGATSSAAGSAGAVPAPAAGENDEFLRGDGTWTFPPNNAVLQTASSANGNYPILLKETTGTSTTTDGSIFDANVYVNPSTGVLTANGFVGNLTGNASTASEWATARTITLSGDATGSVSLDGSADATLNLTIANGSVTNAMLAASSVTFSKVARGDVATQAEAEAGTANNSFMTPLRVAQAIAAQGSSGAVLYTAQTLDASQQTQARDNIAAGSAADVTSQGTRLTAVEKKAADNATAITNLRGDIPTKTSQLTNDSGYVKATSGTTDLTAGTSPLATGELYFVYE